jgi:Carboxypeptidase regulatory-like domain
MKFVVRLAIASAFILFAVNLPTLSQTASTGIVLGTITDPAGALVPDAKVEITNTATNQVRAALTNSSGQYVLPNVSPGDYTLKVTKAGFRSVTANLHVDVTKSYVSDFKLELGQATETVQVESTLQAELQTTDAQVGNDVSSAEIMNLPTLRRNAAALLTLQPGVSPGTGTFPRVGMRVAGAVDDQNVFTLDGIDVSDNVIGGNDPQTIASIPLGAESVEEYRVGVNNPNATFGRASGGQIAVISKSGTNAFHGAGYWFHQNSALNANQWELNHTLNAKTGKGFTPIPKQHDNRFGARIGGPIRADKTFFFFDYEGRRFPQQTTFNRLMPSSLLRQGILQFRDAAGNVVQYNLKNSTLCGSGTACDPRGVGISPSVAALWALDPQGTDPTVAGADGLNTFGFVGTATAPLSTNFYTARIDHEVTKKWRFNGSYTYYQTKVVSGGQNAQYDLRSGTPQATSKAPTDRDAIIAGLTGQITTHLLNTFRFGWVRDRETFNRLAPSASAALENITGTGSSAGPIALAPGQAQTNLVDAPIEVDTQRARFQNITGRNIQYVDDLSWIKGSHTLQFGGNIRHIPTIHIRNDKVVGSLASLEVLSDADVSTFLSSIPNAERPPTCSSSVTTNCLQSSDTQRWDRLYASTLGLVDNIGILTTRDGSLNPLSFGTPLINDTTLNAFEFYAADVWRIKPNLTFSYGLSYGWQTAPKEKLNRQTLVVDASTLKPLTGPGYIAAKKAAALAGQTFNPTLGFEPVKAAGRDVFNTDYGDVAPRVALAWTPRFSSGFLHQIAGDRKTVVRGGFGLVYDRTNTVQSVIIPMLGVGFAQTVTVGAPLCNASGTPGPGCNAAAGVGSPGAASFRVGVDGSLPLPTVPAASIPVVPNTPFGELFSFQDDPDTKIGRSRAADLTIQRELPGNMILEVGWTGRWSDRLPQGVNFNSAPYFFTDPGSKQTFAQAYDGVAAALLAGQTPATQPFFENQLAGLIGSACQNAAGGTVTQYLANAAGSTFRSGLVSSLFSVMDGRRTCLGLPTYQNRQMFDLHMRTYIGQSNYNGMIVTLRKRTSHGLTGQASYTFSKTLDQNISNQNQAGIYSNSYDPNVDYGPSLFDRKHIFNASYLYDLPLGKGHRFGSGSASSRLLGGWFTSGIFTAYAGLPLFVTESSQVWGGGSIFGFNVGMVPTVDPSTFGNSAHYGVAGSNGIGTSGDPANKGTGINLFADPAKTFGDFRNVNISTDGRTGRSRPLRGLPFWNLDMSLGKRTTITEKVSASFSADFFNIFNHVNFVDPTLNISQRASFGVISTQLVPTNRDTSGARWIQLGLRFDF